MPDLHDHIDQVLTSAVAAARSLGEGAPADYIPELANVDLERTSAAVTLTDGTRIWSGDAGHTFTLQSSAKLVVLAGLLEERPDDVFRVVGAEPTGESFASLARLETHGPTPANPLVNTGAIALCGQIRGNLEDRLAWLEGWVERLYGKQLPINHRVMASERRTGDRNRAIAYMLRNVDVLEGDIDDILETYFAVCSFEADAAAASHLPAVLASGGRAPGGDPDDPDARILSPETAATVVSLMATCGMYDESGTHLLRTGLPAKSGVSGVIVAVSPGRAGLAVSSPRLNAKGGSVRGHAILRAVSRELGWHFALPSRM